MVWMVRDESDSGTPNGVEDASTLAPMTGVRAPAMTNAVQSNGVVPIGMTTPITPATLASLGIDPNSASWDKLQAGLGALFVEAQLSAAGTTGAQRLAAMGSFQSTNFAAPVMDGYVTIDGAARDGDGAGLLASLQALGLTGGAAVGASVSGRIPLDAIDDIAALGNLAFARPAYVGTSAGTVQNQADPSLYSDWLRATSGLTGAGVTIGVLSDSFDTRTSTTIRFATDVATGNLPGDFKILADFPNGSDEGRAMAQLIYDIAPGAKQAFYNAFSGQAAFAQGITALSNISKIVVDDVFYFAEPFFSDGIVAKAVDAAVATGDLYFSSAGNQGASSYQASFVNSGVTYTNPTTGVTYRLHDFDTGAGVDTTQRVTQNGSTNYILQWDQPFFSVNPATGGSANDVAFILRTTGGAVIVIQDDGNVGLDPVEIVGLTGTGAFDISIGVRVGTVDPTIVKYIALNNAFVQNEYNTASSTNFGHSNSEGAIAVAAAPFYGTQAFDVIPPRSENFTSKGGTPIYFDANGVRLATPVVRDKVDLTAPDGGNTTFFGNDTSFDTDTLPNFFGTSAAAPNAAALAALLWEKYPTATNAQIEAAMKASAIDITASFSGVTAGNQTAYTGLVGKDPFTGTGLIRAQESITILGQMLGVINSAPVGIDKVVASPATGFYKLGFIDLYTDVNGNPLDTLTIGTVTATGATFTLNGVAVTAGQVIAGIDIENGLLRYVPTAGSEATATGAITFTLKDTGGTAGGGADTDSTPNTLTFATGPRNVAPTSTNFLGDVATFQVNGTGGGVAVKLDTSTAATIADLDSAGAATADFAGGSLRLQIANAVTAEDQLLLDASGGGATGAPLVVGASVTVGGTVIGTVAAGATAYDATITLNAAANSAKIAALLSSVSYGNTNATTATANIREIRITLNDGDGTANGGADTLLLTSAVNVKYVNVAPNGADKSFTIREDQAFALFPEDFGFTDSDGNVLSAVTISTLPTGGILRLSSVAVTAGQAVPFASINSGALVYTPTANASGTPLSSFTFQVQDNGGTTGGGVDRDQSPNTITINAVPLNDAPVGVNQARTITEDTAFTFAASDFGFTDTADTPANTLLSVRVSTLPLTGALTLNGVAVTVGQVIAAAGIPQLVYTPATNSIAGASFTFQVQDNGGTANGGVDLDASPNAFAFTITAVNDAPALTGPTAATVAPASGGNPTPLFAGLTLTDVDYADYAVGGGLTLAAAAGDTLALVAGGAFSVSGNALIHAAGTVGTITGLGTASVAVTFSGPATAAIIDALAESFTLTLGNSSSTGSHVVTLTFTDNGTPPLQAAVTQNVQLDYTFIQLGVGQTSATGTGSPDYITGNATDDTLSGLAGDDRLFGVGGNDMLNGGAGADGIEGGNGIDTVSYSDAVGAVLIDLAARTGTETAITTGTVNGSTPVVTTDLVIDVENAIGSTFGDRFYGTVGANSFAPGAGSDIAIGQGGTDTIDYASATGAVFLDLGASTVTETALTTGTVNGSTAVVSTDIVIGFSDAVGSAFGDRLYGTTGANTFRPGAGNDVAYGGGGTDTIDYANATGAVFLDLTSVIVLETALTTGTVNGSTAVVSTDVAFDFVNAIGSAFGDRLYGTTAANRLEGGAGNDILYGGNGADTLLGGDGADRIIGENGADTMTGGAGVDSFYFIGGETGGTDTITDFATGSDKLLFAAANFQNSVGGTATLVVGANPQAVAPGTFLYDTGTGMLSFDADGAGGAAAVAIVNIGANQALTTGDLVFF